MFGSTVAESAVFSKIEQGKKIYRLRPANLDAVADSAVRAMQFPLAPQGFHQRVSVDKNLPSLPLDPDAIEQAILNLLANTMKYSGVSRDIELRVAARDSNAVIEVADHGLIWAFHACRRSQHKPGTHYIEPCLSPAVTTPG